jgi:uncharacterized repeat protein (TIGR01451 family)
MVLALMCFAQTTALAAQSEKVSPARLSAPAAPIPPPEGYPKLVLSTKTVTPTLAPTGGAIITYTIEIRNTGATTATDTSLIDNLDPNASFTGQAWSSQGPSPVIDGNTLSWNGVVGFDTVVRLRFSAQIDAEFAGLLGNTAVISAPLIAEPVTVTAETRVTDEPVLTINKTSSPAKPGANKPLVYTLRVTNLGQPATQLPITVTDEIPADTTLLQVGPDGTLRLPSDTITWTRRVDLKLGQSSLFTFSVEVGDVPSGTVISNENYGVAASFGITTGQPYTVKVVDPILSLSKQIWPDPPGSNREMTYTLSLFNSGSLATDLVITDHVPAGVTYVRGGIEHAGVVSWQLPRLDTGKSAKFTYTVYVSNVMDVPIVNDDYATCSAENVCVQGKVLTNVVQGPIFETWAELDPIAHKPGGGAGTDVTPTLRLKNIGAGNALDVQTLLIFGRLSVQGTDLYATPSIGTSPPFPQGPDYGDKYSTYIWKGDLVHGRMVTFTTREGRNTIGGEEGTHYTATIVVTDALANINTASFSSTAIGTVTHMANVVPVKSAPKVIGPNQLLTYTIKAYNRGMTTEAPPVLTDVVPLSTTFVRASHDGAVQTMSDTSIVSWTLPLLGPGEGVVRTFAVRTDKGLVSGTQIVNQDYAVTGYGNILTGTVTSGPPFTTTTQEVGLIDSYKTVTPQLSLPGPENILTYEIHLVNSSGLTLSQVTAYDLLPWAASTYQRDANASAGKLLSDIISIDWQGDISPFAEVVLTATVLVDPEFTGALTNTVVISHPDLSAPVEREAVAYVTDQPVLLIGKTATPDPVKIDELLTYRLEVTNLGQQATSLVITDVLPSNVTYVPTGTTGGGVLDGNTIQWELSGLEPGEAANLNLQVRVDSGSKVVNQHYGVKSSEGVSSLGAPVTTLIKGGGRIYLPLLFRNYQ